MKCKRIVSKKLKVLKKDNPQYYPQQENLISVFSILLAVAKRTNPEKYLVGYRKNQ